MNFTFYILDVTARGVQCTPSLDTGDSLWLPRGHPVSWSAPPALGTKVSADVPRWLAQKTPQLVQARGQFALPLTSKPELDPAVSNQEGSFPMSDTPTGRGALFRVTDKKSDRAPDYRGDLTLPDGTKLELAGWLKDDKHGRKFLSISAKPFQERRQEQRAPEAQNTYAAARGREDRQRQPDRGGPTFGDDHIPF